MLKRPALSANLQRGNKYSKPAFPEPEQQIPLEEGKDYYVLFKDSPYPFPFRAVKRYSKSWLLFYYGYGFTKQENSSGYYGIIADEKKIETIKTMINSHYMHLVDQLKGQKPEDVFSEEDFLYYKHIPVEVEVLKRNIKRNFDKLYSKVTGKDNEYDFNIAVYSAINMELQNYIPKDAPITQRNAPITQRNAPITQRNAPIIKHNATFNSNDSSSEANIEVDGRENFDVSDLSDMTTYYDPNEQEEISNYVPMAANKRYQSPTPETNQPPSQKPAENNLIQHIMNNNIIKVKLYDKRENLKVVPRRQSKVKKEDEKLEEINVHPNVKKDTTILENIYFVVVEANDNIKLLIEKYSEVLCRLNIIKNYLLDLHNNGQNNYVGFMIADYKTNISNQKTLIGQCTFTIKTIQEKYINAKTITENGNYLNIHAICSYFSGFTRVILDVLENNVVPYFDQNNNSSIEGFALRGLTNVYMLYAYLGFKRHLAPGEVKPLFYVNTQATKINSLLTKKSDNATAIYTYSQFKNEFEKWKEKKKTDYQIDYFNKRVIPTHIFELDSDSSGYLFTKLFKYDTVCTQPKPQPQVPAKIENGLQALETLKEQQIIYMLFVYDTGPRVIECKIVKIACRACGRFKKRRAAVINYEDNGIPKVEKVEINEEDYIDDLRNKNNEKETIKDHMGRDELVWAFKTFAVEV